MASDGSLPETSLDMLERRLNVNASVQDAAQGRLKRMLTPYNKKALGGGEANFINQCDPYPSSYCVPPERVPQVMEMLEECSRRILFEGGVEQLSYSEPQVKESSGIMLDFDILQKGPASQITLELAQSVITYTFMILLEMIADEAIKEPTHILVLKKPEPVFKADNVPPCYKDGFHIVIPGVMISRGAKRYLIGELTDRGYISSAFSDLGDLYGTPLDKNSAHVPPLFPGNSKAGKPAYGVFAIFKTKYIRPMISVVRVEDIKPFNLVYEFSVNHEKPGGIIKKRPMAVKEGLVRERPVVEAESEEKSICVDYERTAKVVSLLAVSRCEDYNTWFRIMAVLAYMGDEYRDIALKFSGIRPKGVRAEFDATWLNLTSNKGRYPYTAELIHHYASVDNPEEYGRLVNVDAFKFLVDTIFDKNLGGEISHWHIAKLLKMMLPTKYVHDTNKSTGKDEWYEFIVEGDPHLKGEIYKWRPCSNPHTLREIISTKVAMLLRSGMDKIKEGQARVDAANKAKVKFYKDLLDAVKRSYRSLFNYSFKNSVLGECASVFRREGFIDSLDTDPLIMGVGNGVLSFENGIPTLIAEPHKFAISRYTPYDYRRIRADDALALKVFASFANLFPIGEEDAFRYRMIRESTSLTGEDKKLGILMVVGVGANGKTYFDESHRLALNDVGARGYSHKMSVNYLTEPLGDSNSATPGIYGLKYARSTTFSETKLGDLLNDQKLKTITSGDALVGRQLFGNSQSFKVVSTFKVSSNFPFYMEDSSYGAIRRTESYKMKKKCVERPDPLNPLEMEVDPNMLTVNLRDPAWVSTVLSLSVIYYTIFKRKYGGDLAKVPNDTIKNETQEYINRQDTINRFICEKIVDTKDECEIPVSEVVAAYIAWYKESISFARRPDHSATRDSFLESKLVARVVRDAYFQGIRVLTPRDPEPRGSEVMLSPVRKPEPRKYEKPDPDRIPRMFRELIAEHDSLFPEAG